MKINRDLLISIFLYAIIRLFSFYFQPGSVLNTVVSLSIVLTTLILLLKNNSLGWIIVAGEILLGGSGSFFKINTISVRSVLLLTTLFIFFIRNYKQLLKIGKTEFLIFFIIFIAGTSALRGYFLGNNSSRIISDATPYLFLLYFFPLKNLLTDRLFSQRLLQLFFSAVIGGTGFIILTAASFGTGFFILQDAYYHWFRDIAGGKITHVGYNFYRLVLNEHLLLSAAFLYFVYDLLNRNRKYSFYLLLLFVIFSFNLTRVYFISVFIGLFVLIWFFDLSKIWKSLLFQLIIFFAIFSIIFLILSGGKSLGLEVFGFRFQSIILPSSEESSLSRLLLLPSILSSINNHILLGTGLGSTITAFNPILKQNITTPHFDWGYLEIWAEMGLYGLLSWLYFIMFLIIKLKKQPIWMLSVFTSFLTINLTSPALFHVFGFVLTSYLFAFSEHASLKQPALPSQNS